MKVVLDVYGGDNAPEEIVKGAVNALMKEIAEESGFRSANFLTRCFRLRYDIPPLKYRRKHFTGGKL